jgi:formylmethanofuran dehydrogenase subunit E
VELTKTKLTPEAVEFMNARLAESARLHDHLCPRQVLGVRMGMAAAHLLGLELPQKDKRLHVFVETDGCAVDGIMVSTGCQVGRRTMHVLDFGKVAATFADRENGLALRLRPRSDLRDAWAQYAPQAADRWHGYLQAYQVMPEAELFDLQRGRLTISLAALISQEGVRAVCERCGEEIFNEREVHLAGSVLCRTCAGESYFEIGADPTQDFNPVVSSRRNGQQPRE